MKAVQWTVFIDMLGFKKLNSSVTTDDQAQDLIKFMTSNRDELVQLETYVQQGYKKYTVFNFYEWYEVKSAFISDSIVVTFKPKDVVWEKNADRVLMHSANALMIIAMRLGALMHKCLVEKKITFRGGISTEYCDISENFAVGAGLSAAAEAEGRATFARLALAEDVIRNAKLVKQIRTLFKLMYGDSEFLVTEAGVTYVNTLDLMLAAADTRSPSVAKAIFTRPGRDAVIGAREQIEVFLTAQKALVIKSIREMYAAYRKDYADADLRKSHRRVLKKYFWLRRYHNAAAEKRKFQTFKI
ncbi:TPA: hypothetical protein N2B65_003930 [Pseudomonas aeruginosa]|uniref:hypothetical protein n=1 Tax=Pseudomonas aeruginosa TaxID=287 RepID=UPI000F51AFD1|nr:hypothetical protein [Pseudomonas aeruginosa]MDI3649733.1 hypothetical protein [Pseudomonas aeruginosa]WRH84873.1 hypothetical protein RDJ20_12605 [Pseudomonas aeruginosa]HCL3966258.1 hypothetical protein [Pseudomonas aeruginosa]